MTHMAGIGDGFAGTLTTRAGLLYRERSLAHSDLPHAATGGTVFRSRARLGAAAVTGTAAYTGGYTDFDIGAFDGIFETDFKGIA